MSGPVTFWFELASTYSYPAAMRFDAEAEKRGVATIWRPFLLGPIFVARGWSTSPFNIYPDKGRYMWRDVQRICAALELPFTPPPNLPQNSLSAARVATALDAAERPAFARAMYTLQFGEGRDIADFATIEEALRRSGRDPDLTRRARDDQIKHALRQAVEEAQAQGVFGAPSFTTPDGELFWGNDRLETALDWAAAH
jgi:2-hydroxychromene-2-carboxylate isomerase